MGRGHGALGDSPRREELLRTHEDGLKDASNRLESLKGDRERDRPRACNQVTLEWRNSSSPDRGRAGRGTICVVAKLGWFGTLEEESGIARQARRHTTITRRLALIWLVLFQLRDAQNRLEELELTTAHLQKRFDRLKTARSTLLKDLSQDSA